MEPNIKLSNMYYIEVVDLLRATPGRLDKEAIVKEAIETNPGFSEFLQATYNPHVQYFIKKIPEYEPFPSEVAPLRLWPILRSGQLSVLSERKKTGNEAIVYLKSLLMSLNAQDAAALELLIKRDLGCGVSEGTINRVKKGLIPTYPVMLCTAYDEDLARAFRFPAISQLKMDGLRANLLIRNGVVTTKSRAGQSLGLDDVFTFIGAAEPSWNVMLDGEILVLNEDGTDYLPRKTSNGIINKWAKGTADGAFKDRIVFVAWDAIPSAEFEAGGPYNVPYQTRYNQAASIVARFNHPQLRAIESRFVGSIHEAKSHFTNATERGCEGTIIKTLDGSWVDGRPKYQLKLKLENECDLLITDFLPGKDKYAGSLGAIVGVSSDGLLSVNVGIGTAKSMTDEVRQWIWDNRESLRGKVMAVKYNEKIRSTDGSWSLFLPRFMEIRNDKVVADPLSDIK